MLMNKMLKERRKELGLTMKEVADIVGVSEGTISRWESGDISNMRRDRIASYAMALQASTSFIMGLTDDPINYDEIDTSDFNQPVWREILKQNNYNMESSLKQYWNFEKTEQEDAMREACSSDTDIKIVARHLEEIPSDKREALINTINSTIDMYKKAIGMKKKED